MFPNPYEFFFQPKNIFFCKLYKKINLGVFMASVTHIPPEPPVKYHFGKEAICLRLVVGVACIGSTFFLIGGATGLFGHCTGIGAIVSMIGGGVVFVGVVIFIIADVVRLLASGHSFAFKKVPIPYLMDESSLEETHPQCGDTDEVKETEEQENKCTQKDAEARTQQTRYYDTQGHLHVKIEPETKIHRIYDGFGGLKALHSKDSQDHYTYDNNNRVLAVTHHGMTTTRTHDSDGTTTTITRKTTITGNNATHTYTKSNRQWQFKW